MLAWGPAHVAKFDFFGQDFELGRHLCMPWITSGRAISFYTWANPCFPRRTLRDIYSQGSRLNAGGVAQYPRCKSLLPEMETKRKVYTVSTKIQAMVVAAKTWKEATAKHFSVIPRRIRAGWVKLTASDNFSVAQIVRLLRTTTLPTALYNKKASKVTTVKIRVLIFAVCWLEQGSSDQYMNMAHEYTPVPIKRRVGSPCWKN